MVELAIAGNERFAVDRQELERAGPSYTVDTLETLHASRRGAGRRAGPDADPVGRGVPRSRRRGTSRAASWSSHASPSPRATAIRRPGPSSCASISRTWPAASSSSTGRECGCRHPSCASVRRPAAACATWCRMQSRPTSTTMPCTGTRGGTSSRDRSRTRRVVERAPRRRAAAARRGRQPTERPPLELARRIVELAEDKKAADIVLLDLAGLTTMADYFVICSGGSERQLEAIAERHHRQPARRADQADRARGDVGVALGPGRLRIGDRPRLHAARARLLRSREALGGGEDDPARPVTGSCR